MPIISENSTSATAALISAFFRMKAMPGAEAIGLCSGAVTLTQAALDFFDFRPAEQAGRKEDEDDDKNGKRGDVLVFDREIGRPQRLDQADGKSPQHRAGQRAYAPEHCRGEGLDAGDEAHVEIDEA